MAANKVSKQNEPKEPAIYMIALVQGANGKVTGARLVDINDKQRKTKDVSAESCISVLSANPNMIKNVTYNTELKQLKLINGIINNLTRIDTKGNVIGVINYQGNILPRTPLVIVNQIEDKGYTVLNYKGELRRVPVDKLVEEVKVIGVANGIIQYIPDYNAEFIVGIEEPYEILRVSKSKVGDSNPNMRIHMPVKDTSRLARDAQQDFENELNYADVFRSMTDVQKKCVQNYYMWYTVEMYKSLAATLRFDIKVGKAEKLAQLRGDKTWEFGGIVDGGFLGASRCSLGHPLRYEYHAVVFNDDGEVEDRIVFGETCSSDFFDISVEDMRKLVKVRKMMSNEIEIMTDAFANEQVNSLWDGVALLRDCVKQLGKEKTVEVFGNSVGGTLLNFIAHNIPFPESLVKLARKIAYGSAEVGKGSALKFWKKVFPDAADTIDYIYKVRAEGGTKLFDGAVSYLEFMCYNKLDGVYAYDPINKVGKGEGGFNEKTRTARNILLHRIRTTVVGKEFTFEEIHSLLLIFTLYKGTVDNNTFGMYTNGVSVYEANETMLEDIRTADKEMYRTDTRALLVGYTLYAIGPDVPSRTSRLGQIPFWLSRSLSIKIKEPKSTIEALEWFSEFNLKRYKELNLELARIRAFKLDTEAKIKEEALRKEEELRKERELQAENEAKGKDILLVLKRFELVIDDVYKLEESDGLLVSAYSDTLPSSMEDVELYIAHRVGDITYLKACGVEVGVKNLREFRDYHNIGRVIGKLDADTINGLMDLKEAVAKSGKHVCAGTVKVQTLDNIEDVLRSNNILQFNKMVELSRYFKSHEKTEDYYETVARDICSRGLGYSNLSYKQKYIIDTVYKNLCTPIVAAKEAEKATKSELGTSKELSGLVERKVNFILAQTADDMEHGKLIKRYLNEKDPIGLNIVKTVKRSKKYSNKQLRHINDLASMIKVTNWTKVARDYEKQDAGL